MLRHRPAHERLMSRRVGSIIKTLKEELIRRGIAIDDISARALLDADRKNGVVYLKQGGSVIRVVEMSKKENPPVFILCATWPPDFLPQLNKDTVVQEANSISL